MICQRKGTRYLNTEQKIAACGICSQAGVDFVKSSAGFAGGIRGLDTALAFIACGATRLGTSATEKIVLAAREREAAGTLRPMSLEEALRRGKPDHPRIY